MPVADATRPVLHRGQHSRADHLDGSIIRRDHASVMTMRTGVGLKPLQGLLICGQLETSTMVSVSARTVSDLPGAGQAVDDAQCPVGFDRHVHEEVDVRHDVPLAQTPFGALGEEVLRTGMLVHGVVAVAQRVRLLRAGAGDRVVVADLVGDDRHQCGAVGGPQHRAGGQEDIALCGNGCLGVVALAGSHVTVVDPVEQCVDGLVAVQVDDLQLLAGLARRPTRARRRRRSRRRRSGVR